MVQKSSPRPWGCFRHSAGSLHSSAVFPTPVGVFLVVVHGVFSASSLPHARGGVSDELARAKIEARSSPRPWGCFLPRVHTSTGSAVFPTPVGVFPRSCRGCRCHGGLPHARGGVSTTRQIHQRALGSSPRPWGCFFRYRLWPGRSWVFPTPVGVFLLFWFVLLRIIGLPHARGGVSTRTTRKPPNTTSSPRPWGCFQNYQRRFCNHPVFPTPVGSPPYTTSVGSVDCDGHGQVNTGQPAPPANE